MRYSTHVSHNASRSEPAARGSVESAGPGAVRATALARKRDRASEVADRQTAANAVWTEVGEAGAADRATGVTVGRSASETSGKRKPAGENSFRTRNTSRS